MWLSFMNLNVVEITQPVMGDTACCNTDAESPTGDENNLTPQVP